MRNGRRWTSRTTKAPTPWRVSTKPSARQCRPPPPPPPPCRLATPRAHRRPPSSASANSSHRAPGGGERAAGNFRRSRSATLPRPFRFLGRTEREEGSTGSLDGESVWSGIYDPSMTMPDTAPARQPSRRPWLQEDFREEICADVMFFAAVQLWPARWHSPVVRNSSAFARRAQHSRVRTSMLPAIRPSPRWKASAGNFNRRPIGRLTVQVFASMQLGGEKEAIEQAQVGALQMARVEPVARDRSGDRPFSILNLPFLFRQHRAYAEGD